MATICKRCGNIRKDYNNVYGTRCPSCGHLILPLDRPSFIKDHERKKQILQNKVLETVRKKDDY